jgi:thiamine biosynthesis lipoprotein
LGRHAAALVDVGGDIAMCGSPEGGWRVSVDHPNGDTLSHLVLSGGGVATSGRDHRVWRRGDELAHHLIDPRTGLPARTDVVSATVMAASAWDAEYAAKRVLLSGSSEGLAWIERQPRLAAIVVTETHVRSSSKAARYQRIAA